MTIKKFIAAALVTSVLSLATLPAFAEEGKCGEGKCGGDKKSSPTPTPHGEGKCGEGKCGGGK